MRTPGGVLLDFRDVHTHYGALHVLKGVSYEIREGEIVGVAGVAGNGQRELAEAVSGMRDIRSGSIQVAGRRLRGGDPREAILAGVAHVPEDRL